MMDHDQPQPSLTHSRNVSIRQLVRHWIPYRYHEKSRKVLWCKPNGRAQEPFFDDYISRCRQLTPLSQYPSPAVTLDELLQQGCGPLPQPAGFIFHLSRCGSTLVAGCMARFPHSSVLSESQLLTEILLSEQLTISEKQILLPRFLHWQGRPAIGDSVIIKWNAWDLFSWPLLRALYPRVPILFLVRDPIDILASHQQKVGRHMSGDPSLRHLHPVFAKLKRGVSPLSFQITVLQGLMHCMADILTKEKENVKLLDYTQLDSSSIEAIGHRFGLTLSESDRLILSSYMQYDAKQPARVFRTDSSTKKKFFGMDASREINERLSSDYQFLLKKSSN